MTLRWYVSDWAYALALEQRQLALDRDNFTNYKIGLNLFQVNGTMQALMSIKVTVILTASPANTDLIPGGPVNPTLGFHEQHFDGSNVKEPTTQL